MVLLQVQVSDGRDIWRFRVDRWLSKDSSLSPDGALSVKLKPSLHIVESKLPGTLQRTASSIIASESSRTAELNSSLRFAKHGPRRTYSVAVRTGEAFRGGTAARVSMYFWGSLGWSGILDLKQSDHEIKFERAQTDLFEFRLPFLGTIHGLQIWHDGTGAMFGTETWNLYSVTISVDAAESLETGIGNLTSEDSDAEFVFDRWLAEDKHDGKLSARALRDEQAPQLIMSTYSISVVTGDIPNAGTDCQVRML